MKILHTADWHVGRRMRGRSRAEEHRRVLASLVAAARRERVELILVSGDLFDSAAPSPQAEEIVYASLLALADGGAEVVVVAGNHDSAERLQAVRPLLERAGRITVAPALAAPREGGVVELRLGGGERVAIALLPFVSQRAIVRAGDLMDAGRREHLRRYADHLREVIAGLVAGLPTDGWRLLAGHAMVGGARLGGGELPAYVAPDYAIDADAFAPPLDYVALGHVHRAQSLPAAVPVWYCGAPLQLDFGEPTEGAGALLVELAPGAPATVRGLALEGARPLRTVEGSLESVVAAARELGDAWVRVRLEEPPRAGLAEEVRRAIPQAIAVELVTDAEETAIPWSVSSLHERSPREVFAAYLAARDARADRRELVALFARLEEDELAAP